MTKTDTETIPAAARRRVQVAVRCVAPGSFQGRVLNLECRSVDPSVLDTGGPWIIMVPDLRTDFFLVAARSVGVISRRGGACSHLAIVLREMRLPGVVLCDDRFDVPTPTFFASFDTRPDLANELTCEF